MDREKNYMSNINLLMTFGHYTEETDQYQLLNVLMINFMQW